MDDASGDAASLRAALAPLLERVGGEVVTARTGPQDVPVQWRGEVVFHVRLPAAAPDVTPEPGGATDLSDGLARLISAVEDELGGALVALPRPEKQHAVRLLEERGAFEMRRSVDTVAEALGVTRFTVYNYLNRVREA
jgi:hypothetical protein